MMKLQNGQFIIGNVRRTGHSCPIQINVLGVYWEGNIYPLRVTRKLNRFYKQIPQNYIMKCIEFKGIVYKLIKEPSSEIESCWITNLFPVLQKIPEEWNKDVEIGERHKLYFVIDSI